jgi:hypothetical protein
VKKLLVHRSELDTELTQQIELYSTMQMAYGLYEFKRDKLIEEICKVFKLTMVGEEPPVFILQDGEGRKIDLIMKEEYFG